MHIYRHRNDQIYTHQLTVIRLQNRPSWVWWTVSERKRTGFLGDSGFPIIPFSVNEWLWKKVTYFWIIETKSVYGATQVIQECFKCNSGYSRLFTVGLRLYKIIYSIVTQVIQDYLQCKAVSKHSYNYRNLRGLIIV